MRVPDELRCVKILTAVAVVGTVGHAVRADVAAPPGAPAPDAAVAKVVVRAPDLREHRQKLNGKLNVSVGSGSTATNAIGRGIGMRWC